MWDFAAKPQTSKQKFKLVSDRTRLWNIWSIGRNKSIFSTFNPGKIFLNHAFKKFFSSVMFQSICTSLTWFITFFSTKAYISEGKACGEDEITAEVLKQVDIDAELLEFYNHSLHEGRIPDHWKQLLIVPVPKKGDITHLVIDTSSLTPLHTT